VTRKRFPWLATLLTLVMVPILIGLGIWQLERRAWKAELKAQLAAAPTLPPVTATGFAAALADATPLQYRRAVLDCRPGSVKPYDLKGGQSAAGASGFLVLVDCGDPALRHGDGPGVVVVAGWNERPDTTTPVAVATRFDGLIIDRPYGDDKRRPQYMLIPRTAVPPLAPSLMPDPADLSDNHLSYAIQWFSFAAILIVIYGIWLRRYYKVGEEPPVGRA
jgi:surfeit locus 1 family protein